MRAARYVRPAAALHCAGRLVAVELQQAPAAPRLPPRGKVPAR
jgi:hypothetical protein